MNNEEKIRLVLDVLGVDTAKNARKVLEELEAAVDGVADTSRETRQALDDLDEKIDEVGDSGRKTKKDLDELDKSIDKAGETGRKRKRDIDDLGRGLEETGRKGKEAAGTRGLNGHGILTLAYAVDDLQYGLKGIVNNIPQVAQALGLGMGFAGVAGIAAVAINQLVAKHPEWFEWSNKVQLKLKELADTIIAEEEAVKRQKKAVDDLADSNKGRIEDILKLKTATDDLKQAEEQLSTDRANRKAAEEAAENPGKIAKEELAKNRAVFKELIEDTGSSKRVQDTMRQRLLSDPEMLAKAGEAVGTDGVETDLNSEIANQWAVDNNWHPGFARGFMERHPAAREGIVDQYSAKAKAAIQERVNNEVETIIDRTIGGMSKTAETTEEFQKAFNAFAQVMPQTAGTLGQERRIRAEDEQFDRENTRYSKRAAERRAEEKAVADRQNAIGPTYEMFEIAERQRLVRERDAAEKEQMKYTQRQEAIRNEALQGLDTLEMAVTRRQQAGTGRDAGRNLQRLEQRDTQNFRTLLMHKGMSGGEAEDAARESLRGGESYFQSMAQNLLGFSLDSAADGFRASVAVTQQLNLQVGKANADIEAMKAQLHAMGAGNGSPARPQTRRRIGN